MKADGILGLSPSGSDILLSNMFNSGQIEEKVISFSLDNNIFTIGGYDVTRFARKEAQLVWVPKIESKDDSN